MTVFAFTGCSSPPDQVDESDSSSAHNNEGDKGTELTLAIGHGHGTEGFDPTTGWGTHGGSLLFHSALLKLDDQLNIVNDLAKSYEVSDDGKTWTVQLRQDAKFSDGKQVTAEDVKFTFETAAEKGSIVDLTNLQRVEVIKGDTVTFTLKEPQSTFIHRLVTLGIVPRHAYDDAYAEHPIGSGPYKFVQWDKEQQLIVEANPEYYGTEPYFKKLTFLFLDEDAAFASAKKGDVDIVSIPSAFSKQTVSGMRLEAISTVDNRGIVFPYVPSGNQTKDGQPIGNDVTSDIAIRQAVNFAIDRQKLVDEVLEGYGSPAYTVVDGLPWWNEETKFRDADVDRARTILAEAGWQDKNGDGVLEKDSLSAEFTLIYPSNDVVRQSLALAVADMVKPLGIHIQVEGKSWDEIDRMKSTHAILFGFGSHDPTEMYNLHHSKYQGVDFNNPGYYNNPAVDQWLDKALTAKREQEALEYWKKAQWDGETGFSALGDAPWAWLVNIDHLYLVNDRLDIGRQRIHPHGEWDITYNIEAWKWKE